jgi:penicillin G amidase
MGGSSVTVGAAGWDPLTGEVNHGAAWRTIVDLKDLTKSLNVVGPGQSGHLLSSWYQNQMDDWATGNYHITYTYTNPSKYQQDAAKLTLTPN